MLRKLITFLTIYLCFYFNVCVYHISLGGIVPNILIIIPHHWIYESQNTEWL